LKSHRGLIYRAVLTGAVVLVCAPACAQAGSLLSGYGGPGQGSQALLGSTVVGGSGGGGGSSSSGGGRTSSGAGSGSPTGSLAAAPATSGRSTGAQGSRAARRRGRVAALAVAAAPAANARPAALHFHETGAGSSTLGLSGIDLAYILAVLCGLVVVALLTRGLARSTRTGAHD
jgi:hypothetical protein